MDSGANREDSARVLELPVEEGESVRTDRSFEDGLKMIKKNKFECRSCKQNSGRQPWYGYRRNFEDPTLRTRSSYLDLRVCLRSRRIYISRRKIIEKSKCKN